MFVKSKERLKFKFDKLSEIHHNTLPKINSVVKEVTMNLCNDKIPPHQKSLLNLGPNFKPTPKSIPYMDIITKKEVSALQLLYNNKRKESEKLRQVLRVLKMAKPQKSNLTRPQQKALAELKKDETTNILI